MNCKKGDLAIVVRSVAGNEGKIVRCVEFLGDSLFVGGKTYAAWSIDRKLPGILGGMIDRAPDAWLRPIRDNDQEDETLTWAGKPEKATA